jgi:hypothetical protein
LWNRLRKDAYEKVGCKCVVCGSEEKWECHEEWDFNDETKVQTLSRLMPLCVMCHKVKHIDLSMNVLEIPMEKLVGHFCKVNDCSVEDFEDYNQKRLEIWSERNEFSWKVSLGEFSSYHPGEVVNHDERW